MPRNSLAHTPIADRAIASLVEELLADGTASTEAEAIRIACATMDGAGEREGATVESMQTCRDLEGKAVAGLTSEDGNEARVDPYAKSMDRRHAEAEKGVDEAAKWLARHGEGRGRRS